MSIRLSQPSFASGEITPLLHARTDLARYATALAKLENMIVLPEGGVTRRPGFRKLGDLGGTRKLIPFVYNATDSAMLEFGDKHVWIWLNGTAQADTATPYALKDVNGLRYAQSGNVMILAHRNYPLQILTRNSLTNWTLKPFEFDGGPWIPGDEVKEGAEIDRIVPVLGSDMTVRIVSTVDGTFTSEMIGSMIKLEYAIAGNTQTLTVGASNENYWIQSDVFEVRSSFNVCTATNGADKWWEGKILIERKLGRNGNWMTVREFVRGNTQQEGQIDFTVTETEENVFYRVELYRTGGSTEGESMVVSISAAGFVKSLTFRITNLLNGSNAYAKWVRSEDEAAELPGSDDKILGWWLSAWGRGAGSYPAAVAFYQDRLVLAGSIMQPQTIWMSRVGDYKNFSTSDPLADDDAITITLTARTSDGIHSMVAAGDLLAFTNAGEWKISGAGDAGAISPKAIVAHQQSNIGSKAIQPLLVNGRVIFVQTHGTKVYSMGYDLSADGYTGSEISILSSHLFDGAEIMDFAWQQVPDSLLWFALSDGTAATCTYNPEHETIGWARQRMAGNGKFQSFACVPGNGYTELWGVAIRSSQYVLLEMTERASEIFTDIGTGYESIMQTLRITIDGQNGSAFPAKKLIPRLTVSAIKSEEAWAAPADWGTRSSNWEQRRRKITWDYTGTLTDAEVQMDSGFANDASIQIRTSDGPLTVAAIIPMVAIGG